MPVTQIGSNDIKDKGVKSSDIDDIIKINTEIQLSTGVSLKYATATDINSNQIGYLGVLTQSSSAQHVALNRLLVSNDYTQWNQVPAKSGSAYFKGDVTIEGDITVKGTTTSINTETINLADNIVVLNSNYTGSTPTENGGIDIERGTLTNASLYWDETNGHWSASHRIADGTIINSRLMTSSGRSVFNTDANVNPVYITRTGSTTSEFLSIGVTDSVAYFYYKNDEAANSVVFQLENTDLESGGGVNQNTGYFRFYQAKNITRLGIGTLADPAASLDVVGDIKCSAGLEVGGNITMASGATVDGIDISAHASNSTHLSTDLQNALTGTDGTPSNSNKFVTNSDTRLSNNRTPTAHGDSAHNALSYLNSVTYGASTVNATTSIRNLKFMATGCSMTLTSDATSAILSIDASHNHNSQYLSLSGGTITSNLTVQGNLTVSGTTTYMNTETLEVYDNIMLLNSNVTAAPTENAGIEIERGTSTNTSILWNEATDKWTLTNDGATFSRIVTQSFDDDITINKNSGKLIFESITSGNSNSGAIEFKEDSSSVNFSIKYDGTDGAGTGGRLVFSSPNSSTDNILVVDRNGKVGIGVALPTEKLHVNGGNMSVISGDATQTCMFVGNTSTGNAVIYLDASDGNFTGSDYAYIRQNNNLDFEIVSENNAGHMRFRAGGAERLTILKTGEVGIGSSNPTAKLCVQGASGTEEVCLMSGVDSTGSRHGIQFKGGASNVEARIKAGNFGSYYGGLVFEVKTAGTAGTTTEAVLTLDYNKLATFAGAVTVNGNISVTGTVDGRDVSTDGGKIDTLETIRSKRIRKRKVLTAPIQQDTPITLTSIGLTGISWDSNSIVLVIVDGQVNGEDIDAANKFDYSRTSTDTITFNYDVPSDSILEVIVL